MLHSWVNKVAEYVWANHFRQQENIWRYSNSEYGKLNRHIAPLGSAGVRATSEKARQGASTLFRLSPSTVASPGCGRNARRSERHSREWYQTQQAFQRSHPRPVC